MPTLKQAQEKVIELATKAYAYTQDETLSGAELKKLLTGDDGESGIEGDIKKWEDEVASLKYVSDKAKQFQAQSGTFMEEAAAENAGNPGTLKSWGQQFVESQKYKDTIGAGLKGGRWSSGEVEIKTTLTEGSVGTPGGGYAIPTAVPSLVPGIVDLRFRQPVIADLFPQGSTNSPLIRYLVETVVVNAAAPTAEGGLKPESSITFAKVDETLHKIATFLPISDEMLEDWAQAQSYIDARLGLFIQLSEDTQLISGDGVGVNLLGLLNRTGLAPAITLHAGVSVATDTPMDAIYRQITQIRVTSFLEPDAIAADPLGWQDVLLSKNSQGSYYANGPFVDQQNQALWGKRTVVTPALPASSALVGAFAQGGQVFRKGGVTVEASNSHADFFQRDQTAIRAFERAALAVYRPGAFGQVLSV